VEKYNGDVSSLLLWKESILAHVAKMLHQCNSANVAEGGWVGEDAWFQLIPCMVELLKKKGFFTITVRQNKKYSLLQVIWQIMKAQK
jgi:hypothetical protein